MVRQRSKAASPEFRREVLRMVARGDKSIPEIEQDLGLTKGIVYRWVERYGGGLEDNGTGQAGREHPVNLREAEAEIRRLKKALAQAEEERDILKKAVRIFSREQP
jgi:transposase